MSNHVYIRFVGRIKSKVKKQIIFQLLIFFLIGYISTFDILILSQYFLLKIYEISHKFNNLTNNFLILC